MSLTMVNRGVVNCNRTNTHVSSLGQIISKENLHMLNVYINCSYSHLLNIHFLILKSLSVHGKHINDNAIHKMLTSKGKKGKAVPLQASSGPEGSMRLRFPDFMATAQGCGKFVSLTYWPHLPPGSSPGTYFC